jgi:glucan biosynthesis protein C
MVGESVRPDRGLRTTARGAPTGGGGSVAVAIRHDHDAARPSAHDAPAGSVATFPAAAPRIHFVDWLRVLAIAGVFAYHTFRPFNEEGWHVKNAETSAALDAGMAIFWSFGLATLFLLAGAGARFALRRRSWQTFVRERTARLLVPFVAGTLLLGPLQGFIEAKQRLAYPGSFLDYLGVWAGDLVDRLAHASSPTIAGIGYHLWFLGFLFAISVLALPLLRWLMGDRGSRAVDALARAMRPRGATLAFALPIAAMMTTGVLLGTDDHDWFEFFWYTAYYLVGFVFFADDRFLAAVRRDLRAALAVALVSTTLLVATPVGGLLTTMDEGFDAAHFMAGVLFALEGWAWTLVVLNAGLRFRRFQRPVSAALGDAVLPVYVLHQPVILAVAFFVVQWPLGILPKWIAVFGLSLGITVALVVLGLRARPTRVLLGARLGPRTAAEPAGSAPIPTATRTRRLPPMSNAGPR